mgnify:CR=1 FL=1
MSKILFTYEEKLNQDGAALPGIPLDDITQEFFDSLRPDVQRAIEKLPFYKKVKAVKAVEKVSSKTSKKAGE